MICTVDKCEKEVQATGLCVTHYQRMRRNGHLEARKILIEQDPTGRVCTKCDEHKPWTEFYRRKNGYFSECKDCFKESRRVRYAELKDAPE
jgi:hypothetical protein